MSGTWESQKERGTKSAILLLLALIRVLGRNLTRLILWPIVAYYLAVSASARKASHDYLQRVLGRQPRLSEQLTHLHCFASCTLDRILIPVRDKPVVDIDIQRSAEVEQLIDRKQPFLVLVAHLGSFEVLRVTGTDTHQIPLKILLDRQQGKIVTELMEQLHPGFASSILDAARSGPDLVLALREAFDKGFNVGVMADRVRASEPRVDVDFLGGRIALPASPWILAHALKVPVVVAFGMFFGGRRYEARFDVLFERVLLQRDARDSDIQVHAQAYADKLEEQLKRAPMNWFNFYPYWLQEQKRNI